MFDNFTIDDMKTAKNRHKCRVHHKKYRDYINKRKKRNYYSPDCDIKKVMKNSHLKKHYAITLKEYENMLEKQQGLCAICRKIEVRMIRNKIVDLSVDHSHETGKVRELLCNNCNTAMGLLQENLSTLENMIAYLKKHS